MKVVVEVLESIALLLCLVLAAPIRLFRRLDKLMGLAEHARFLIKRGFFAALLRSRLDYRMYNFQQAIVHLNPIILDLEGLVKEDKSAPIQVRRLLCTLYCDLQQLYMLCGQMEEAVLVVLRAHQNLGIDRLPSNPDLDLKTAHVIKAGIAASKLLEEGGFATLMVRQGEEPVVGRPGANQKSRGFKPEGKPVTRSGATVIPFPLSPHRTLT